MVRRVRRRRGEGMGIITEAWEGKGEREHKHFANLFVKI